MNWVKNLVSAGAPGFRPRRCVQEHFSNRDAISHLLLSLLDSFFKIFLRDSVIYVLNQRS